MTEILTVYKSKIPDFAAYPLSKSKLEDYLCTLSHDTIDLHFVEWSSDTGFEHNFGRASRKTIGVKQPADRSVLRAFFNRREERWVIWIYPVRKTILAAVKAALVPNGLNRLQSWFAKQATPVSSNTQSPGHFCIAFDGKELTILER